MVTIKILTPHSYSTSVHTIGWPISHLCGAIHFCPRRTDAVFYMVMELVEPRVLNCFLAFYGISVKVGLKHLSVFLTVFRQNVLRRFALM